VQAVQFLEAEVDCTEAASAEYLVHQIERQIRLAPETALRVSAKGAPRQMNRQVFVHAHELLRSAAGHVEWVDLLEQPDHLRVGSIDAEFTRAAASSSVNAAASGGDGENAALTRRTARLGGEALRGAPPFAADLLESAS
jgi:hypothetical protein